MVHLPTVGLTVGVVSFVEIDCQCKGNRVHDEEREFGAK